MDTPAFLIWSLEYSCQVRGFETGRDPERAERLLRAARAASDAVLDGRVFDGICVSPPYGFRLDEALAIYGGREALDAACYGCPANARSRWQDRAWAGCFGMVALPGSFDELDQRFASHLALLGAVPSPPVWPKLWMHSPIAPARATELAAVLEAGCFRELGGEFDELRLGLMAAAREQVPLHVVAYPPGWTEDGWWRLAKHCPQCKWAWGKADERLCHVCGYRGPPAPDKKRRVRGRRPYVLLERLLGGEAARTLAARYEAATAQPGSLDPALGPPRPEPPGSLPGG